MEQEHYVVPVRTYLMVFVVLMILVATTVSASFIDLGIISILIVLSIATTKAGLIMLYFMHLRYSPKLFWVFAGLAAAMVVARVVYVLFHSEFLEKKLGRSSE